MADQNIVAATLKVDASSAVTASKSVTELKDNVKQLQKEFENTKVGTTAQAEAYKKLTAAQDELKASSNNLNKSSADGNEHFKNLKSSLGNISPAASAAGESVGRLSGVFKALLANPVVLVIVAIVGALTLLYKAFTNTFEGAEKVEQIFAGVKAAAQALFDDLGHIGSAIAKFFTFDFSGAADEIKGIVSDVGHAYTAMSALTKKAQEIHKEQLQNDLEQAQRQKQLAILREQASDDTIPLAKRKEALLALKKAAEENAKSDIKLATETRDNVIAQKTLEKDGINKNQDEINKAKIAAVQVETDNANELRRIDKQLTAANKQEESERAEAAKAAAEQKKKIAADLAEYQKQLLKLTQENELLSIKDSYAKEVKQLEIKTADEKKSFDDSLKAKKINQEQYNKLTEALQINSNLQLDAINEKHNKDVADKEIAFQNKLNDLKEKILLEGIDDSRKAESVKLEIEHQKQIKQAAIDYKDDATKFQQVKNLIDADIKAQQEKLDAKNKAEDDKKKFDAELKKNGDVINDPTATFKAKQDALNADVAANQAAFDAKKITEEQYNANVKEYAESRQAIRDEELANISRVSNATADLLGTVSSAIGENTAAGKAFAIAAATIKALQTEITIIAGLSEVGPFGFIAGIAAAAATAITLGATIKKIRSVPVPGHGSGGGGTSLDSPVSVSAPVIPKQQVSTRLDADSISAINNPASGGVNRSFRAYVVESDNAEAANRAARLKEASVLGGG